MALVFYLLLLFLHYSRLSSADPLYKNCDGGSYTINGTYNTNLNNLLAFFTSLNSTSFTTRTQGSNPNSIYGLILCRGDISSSDCASCIKNAARDVLPSCPTSKQATIWYDDCELRYSDLRFFSTIGSSFPPTMYNTKKITGHVANFTQMWTKLLDNMTYQAAYNSPLMFVTGTARNGSDATVNGLAQCTRDLSKDGCSQCLKQIWGLYTYVGLEASRGGRGLGDSCNFRYEVYSFFQGKPTVLLNLSTSLPPPSSTPPSTPPSAGAKGPLTDSLKKKRQITIAVILSFVLGLPLLSCIIYLVWRKKKTIREVNWNEDEDLELPLYDLDIIIAGTDNFSTENKLGEGGFGSVYKVLSSSSCSACSCDRKCSTLN